LWADLVFVDKGIRPIRVLPAHTSVNLSEMGANCGQPSLNCVSDIFSEIQLTAGGIPVAEDAVMILVVFLTRSTIAKKNHLTLLARLRSTA
jgi:hypothetical protein